MIELNSLTKYCRACTSRLTSTPVNIKVRMTAGAPLSQNAGPRVNDIDKMRVGFIQISCIVRRRIEKYRWIQTSDASELSLLRFQLVCNETGYMSSDTVSDEMHTVWRYPPWMLRNVLHQLSYAQTAEPGRPFHLAQTWFLHRTTIIHDYDVVVAELKVCIADVRTGRKISATAKTMDYYFGGVSPIEMCVIEGLRVQHIQFLWCLLCTTRIQIELDLRMRTPVRLLKARFRFEDIGLCCYFADLRTCKVKSN